MTPGVVIVGGGISGLAAAHRLVQRAEAARRSLEVTILEAAPRLGGAIVTEHIQDFVIEGGPDSFLTEKPWALELSRELGLEPHLVGTNQAYRRTYIAHRGRLHPLPEGFLLLAPTRLWPFALSPLFSWSTKLRMAAEVLLPRGRVRDDESLASFVRRRFGRRAVELVAQPLIGGIYLAKAERLSLRATMPRFLTMEEQHRSIILGMRAQARRLAKTASGSGARWSLFASFDHGLQALVDALTQRLRSTRVCLSTAVIRIERRGPGWSVVTERGTSYSANAVILAVPASRAASLVRESCPDLARELDRIPTLPSLTVNLAYPHASMGTGVTGFGVVVPRTEGYRTWACTLSHRKYPGRAPAGALLLRAFLGGEDEAEILNWEEGQIVALVRREVESLLQIEGMPLFARVHRYPHTMPLYEVGHLHKVQRIEECLSAEPTLALAGNSYRGVGLPDCIHSGQQAAEKLWKAAATLYPSAEQPARSAGAAGV
ncbi:MAG: protoporphyrinogen oxidase [Candidatus Binatia bacterium]|nr:MAG: protoporphyrinogen oxidase [Candidatus Binatia bacterium]